MKLGLTIKECRNKDIKFNTNQIKQAVINARKEKIDFIFFGESFLQGFDSLTWNYDVDKDICISKDNLIVKDIKNTAKTHCVGVGFGYFENENNNLYSSYLIINQEGEEIINYKRISKGWKYVSKTNERYKEGAIIPTFKLGNQTYTVALCGDLWDNETKDRFLNKKDVPIIWPVHVDFTLEAWASELPEYHKQAQLYSDNVLLINNLMLPSTHGGAFIFQKSNLQSFLFDHEGTLIYEVE